MASRRRRKGLLDRIADAIPLPPWWVWAILAAGSFVLLRWLAGLEVPRMTQPGQLPSTAIRSLVKGLAIGAQFLFPPLFLLAAGVTFMRDALRRSATRTNSIDPEWSRNDAGTPNIVPDGPAGPDLYQEWTDVDGAAPTGIDESRWNMGLLKALEWKRFEILCSTYFEAIGLRSRRAYGGPDGGIDIRLFAKGVSEPGILVQCKAWRDRQVGVALVRELYGVMTAENVPEGILVTTSKFSTDAVAFAKGKNIHLIDGDDFLGKLLDLPAAKQDGLRRQVIEGDYTTPTCPSCGDGTKMKFRTSGKDGTAFWGCSNFPRCRTTIRAADTARPDDA
jgi:restriction system protein